MKYPAGITKGALEEIFKDCGDFQSENILTGGGSVPVYLYFIDGLVMGSTIAESVIRPLTSSERMGSAENEKEVLSYLSGGAVYGYALKERTELDDVVSDLLNGRCVILLPKTRAAVTFEVKTAEKRSISEPMEEKVVKGAKDGFIEQIRTNTMLIRRKLKTADLKVKQLTVGRDSATQVEIIYISGLTNMGFVDEMEKRLKSIDIDGALTAGSIEEYITDNPRSPFPQLLRTERPDRFAMNLLEGRVGVLIDGLPMGYMAPGTLAQFIKVPEDAAEHYLVASALTLLRYTGLIISLLLPAIYVAIALYHQEMLPTKLMQSIIDSKQSVPFPTWVEALAMLAAFDLLQEAGLRLPNTVGETVSIIGALIVGQSAVEAKVVSPVVVIVIALAGIAGYTIPNQDLSAAVRMCRFLLVIAAILGGMFGVAIGVVLLVYHLSTIDSFGVAYLSPFSGEKISEVLRAVVRLPESQTNEREAALSPQRIKRRK